MNSQTRPLHANEGNQMTPHNHPEGWKFLGGVRGGSRQPPGQFIRMVHYDDDEHYHKKHRIIIIEIDINAVLDKKICIHVSRQLPGVAAPPWRRKPSILVPQPSSINPNPETLHPQMAQLLYYAALWPDSGPDCLTCAAFARHRSHERGSGSLRLRSCCTMLQPDSGPDCLV